MNRRLKFISNLIPLFHRPFSSKSCFLPPPSCLTKDWSECWCLISSHAEGSRRQTVWHGIQSGKSSKFRYGLGNFQRGEFDMMKRAWYETNPKSPPLKLLLGSGAMLVSEVRSLSQIVVPTRSLAFLGKSTHWKEWMWNQIANFEEPRLRRLSFSVLPNHDTKSRNRQIHLRCWHFFDRSSDCKVPRSISRLGY